MSSFIDPNELFLIGLAGYRLNPIMGLSSDWKEWVAIIDLRVCGICFKRHGTIFPISEILSPKHPNCRCYEEILETIQAGTITIYGIHGADWELIYNNAFPSNYITKKQARKLGWVGLKGNLHTVAPGNLIGGDIFWNREAKLPYAIGRIWYEADINYISGHRNKQRLYYSSDSLIFVSFDHGDTFYEVIE